MNDPKHLVSHSYDQIAERYLEWRTQGARENEHREWLLLLNDHVPPGARVLDIGCGAGIPLTLALSETFDTTGIDISARQIELARAHVPAARFIHADVTALDFPSAVFDAIIASYSLFHIPRSEHHSLFRSIARWLRPGGILLANFGVSNYEADYEDDWLGAPMFWSSFDADGERAALLSAGFDLILERVETIVEDDQPHQFLLVVAMNMEP